MTSINIEKANSYRMMFESWPWKDFEAFLDAERMSALELGINSSDIKDVQLNRGKVQQIDSIKSHLGYVINEQK